MKITWLAELYWKSMCEAFYCLLTDLGANIQKHCILSGFTTNFFARCCFIHFIFCQKIRHRRHSILITCVITRSNWHLDFTKIFAIEILWKLVILSFLSKKVKIQCTDLFYFYFSRKRFFCSITFIDWNGI